MADGNARDAIHNSRPTLRFSGAVDERASVLVRQMRMSEGEGGTAFWRHKATGAHRIDPGDIALFEQVKGDWADAAKWEQSGLAEMKLGRMVIYESALFHSRWPFAAFGTDYDSGRLVAVAFFTPRA